MLSILIHDVAKESCLITLELASQTLFGCEPPKLNRVYWNVNKDHNPIIRIFKNVLSFYLNIEGRVIGNLWYFIRMIFFSGQTEGFKSSNNSHRSGLGTFN